MPNITKVSAEMWLAEAKIALINDGVAEVKIDRLGRTLGVTRGGFYHHFKNRNDLLHTLLDEWKVKNLFLPPQDQAVTKDTVFSYIDSLIEWQISEAQFSPAFEMAVREWGRVDTEIQADIDEVDRVRSESLTKIFRLVGYAPKEAKIRSRILYLHQIGYYAMRLHLRETKAARRKLKTIYMEILCGPLYSPS